LADRGLVHYDPYRQVTLTEPGRQAAEEITDRHRVLRRFLTRVLGVAPSVAEANACRMEHVVDNVVLDRLTAFGRFVAGWPPAMQKELNDFLVRPPSDAGPAPHAASGAGTTGGRRRN
jgi:DtxR family Mn-dependent transcriptional regulator